LLFSELLFILGNKKSKEKIDFFYLPIDSKKKLFGKK